MRLISQNGAIDVPYEMSAIRNEDKIIVLNMVGETGKGSVIATYSTSEKAEKAMEMLRESYGRLCNVKVLASGSVKHLGETFSKNELEKIINGYQKMNFFRFPTDEDLEVSE